MSSSHPVDAEQVKADAVSLYLRKHPDFLQRHPELLAELKLVPKQQGNATSLAAYQLEVLREKNAQLHAKLTQLIQIAQENELLVQRVHQLALRLLKSRNLHETVQQIAASLQEDFRTDLLKLGIYNALVTPHQAVLSEDFIALLPETEARALFSDAFRNQQPICGRLRPELISLMFGPRASEVASAVMVPLEPVGLLAIASGDANHFHPGMGTTVLEMIGELLRNALSVRLEK
jgi:uncharacterized protein